MVPRGRSLVGRATNAELGKEIHKVPDRLCPVCEKTGLMRICERGVRWPCGHTRSLPPPPTGSNGKTRTS